MNFEPYTPVIDRGIYPAEDWREITDFEYVNDLYLARAKNQIADVGREQQYVVSAQYGCRFKLDGEVREIVVPSGMLTDLTSVPSLARPLIGRVGEHLEAAIVHDFLFIAWQDIDGYEPTVGDFRFSNELMLQAMKAAGVSWWRRNAIFAAVSTFVGRQIFFEAEPEGAPRYVRVPSPPKPYETPAVA